MFSWKLLFILQEWADNNRFIRVMPNTPSAVGEAASGMTFCCPKHKISFLPAILEFHPFSCIPFSFLDLLFMLVAVLQFSWGFGDELLFTWMKDFRCLKYFCFIKYHCRASIYLVFYKPNSSTIKEIFSLA